MFELSEMSGNIISFDLFGVQLSLKWYALSYIAGFFVARQIMVSAVRKKEYWRSEIPPTKGSSIDDLITYLIIGVILGGRLGYVLFYNPEYYLSEPIKIFYIWQGGMSFHGGLIGVILAAVMFSKRHNIHLLSLSDLLAIATPPGLFFGRIANFANGELWGAPTEIPWGVKFPKAPCAEGGLLCFRHPTQLYEAFLEGLCLFIILYILVRFVKLLQFTGAAAGLFLSWYGSARFFVEYFREPDSQFVTETNPDGFIISFGSMGLSMGQLLSVPMIIVGIIFIYLSWHDYKKFNKDCSNANS